MSGGRIRPLILKKGVLVVLCIVVLIRSTIYIRHGSTIVLSGIIPSPNNYTSAKIDSDYDDPIHILITVCNGGNSDEQKSMSRYAEFIGLVRTIQRYGYGMTQQPQQNISSPGIIVHVFTDDASHLQKLLQQPLTSKIIDRLDIRVHDIVKEPKSTNDYDRYRKCASARLYAQYLFQSAGETLPERFLYLDTDTLVTAPLRQLWQYATEMFNKHPDALFAMVQECQMTEDMVNAGARGHQGENITALDGTSHLIFAMPKGSCLGYNSGVLFAHLHRWQVRDFPSMVLEQEAHARTYNYESSMKFGDQGILNTMAARFPERLVELPCYWNMRSDSMQTCLPHWIKNGGGILHGNRRKFHTSANAKLLREFLVRDDDSVDFVDFSISRWLVG